MLMHHESDCYDSDIVIAVQLSMTIADTLVLIVFCPCRFSPSVILVSSVLSELTNYEKKGLLLFKNVC